MVANVPMIPITGTQSIMVNSPAYDGYGDSLSRLPGRVYT